MNVRVLGRRGDDAAGDPAPTDPAPTDPAPTDPAPTDPAPIDPARTDAAAAPAAAQPAAAQPAAASLTAAPPARTDAPATATAATADEPFDVVVPVTLGDRLRGLLSSGEQEPMYPRVLRLKHVHPNGWQRAILVEGMMLAGALVALADRATAWAPLVLPVGAAAVVKFHDVLAGLLPQRPAGDEPRDDQRDDRDQA